MHEWENFIWVCLRLYEAVELSRNKLASWRLARRRETSQLRQTSPLHIFSVLHQLPVWFFLYRVSILISLPTDVFY